MEENCADGVIVASDSKATHFCSDSACLKNDALIENKNGVSILVNNDATARANKIVCVQKNGQTQEKTNNGNNESANECISSRVTETIDVSEVPTICSTDFKSGAEKTGFMNCKIDCQHQEDISADIQNDGRTIIVQTENLNGPKSQIPVKDIELEKDVGASRDSEEGVLCDDNGANKLTKLMSTMVIKDNEIEREISFVQYKSEEQLPDLVALITVDLSEPYSVYTYRYFLHNWPHLSHLAYHDGECVGAIVCKLDIHRKSVLRGYIAMLVVHKDYRRSKIGSRLVKRAVKKMIEHGCEEVVLETEVTNKAALKLYENLGFVRDKRLLRYYLNGVDAWRLKLWLK